MKSAPFTYHRPLALDHATELLARFATDGGRVLAGGQSLIPLMALRLAQPPHLIDINRVPFGSLRAEAGALCIPAGVRHAALLGRAVPPPLGPALAAVARHIAHAPIRSRGTVCGSLAHADPAAEWPLVFVTLGGEAVARSTRGERRIPASDFLRDIMTTALEPDEILAEIRLELPPLQTQFGFHEISRRAGDYAMAMAFTALEWRDGRVAAARIGLGGAEPRPRRVAAAEAELVGSAPGGPGFDRAADAAAAAIDPMEDLQVDASFRRDLVRAAVSRALRTAA